MTDKARLHDRYPELGAGSLPVGPYIDPAYWEAEKKHLFKKTWLHIGRVEELPKKGSYMVRDIAALDASIVVARDRSGEINAFHNVCSHRLNKIAYQPYGTTRKFACRFHGWAYDLDGSLSGVPDEKSFLEGFDKACLGLSKVSCDVWQGFIFINMELEPAQTLAEFMEPMYGGLDGYPFEKFTACYGWSTVVDANWKFALDAFQETYHVAYLHGRSIADSLDKNEEGMLHPIDGLCGDVHRRLSIAGNPNTVYGNPQAATSGLTQSSVLGSADIGKRIASKALAAGAGARRSTCRR